MTAARKARLPMPAFLRKCLLALHVALSVGWLGAAAAYLSIAVAALASGQAERMRSAYPTLELLGWCVIVPLCLAALISGVVQSLGTPWGLFRHYWVVAKLALTLVATGVLLGHMPAVGHAARQAALPTASVADLGHVPVQLVVHAAGGIVVLLVVVAISIFKPWGLTPLGARSQRALAGANGKAGHS